MKDAKDSSEVSNQMSNQNKNVNRKTANQKENQLKQNNKENKYTTYQDSQEQSIENKTSLLDKNGELNNIQKIGYTYNINPFIKQIFENAKIQKNTIETYDNKTEMTNEHEIEEETKNERIGVLDQFKIIAAALYKKLKENNVEKMINKVKNKTKKSKILGPLNVTLQAKRHSMEKKNDVTKKGRIKYKT